MDVLDLQRAAVEAGRLGADVLRRYFRSADLVVGTKAQHDFVTQADRESEQAIVGLLRERFPDHDIVGEEGGSVGVAGADCQWLIDPLDGTTNFLQGLPVFAVSIACRHQGRLVAAAIHDPLGENWFVASRGGGAWWNGKRVRVSSRSALEGAFLATGYPFRARAALDLYLSTFREVFLRARAIRRCGAAALDLAYTAAGVYDGFFEFRLSPWDVAAGALLVLEAGGELRDLDGGDRYLERGNVLAGSAGVVRDLVAAVAPHASERMLDELVPTDPAVVEWIGAAR